MAKTVTNILKLLPTHFASNIRHQHRFNQARKSIFFYLQFQLKKKQIWHKLTQLSSYLVHALYIF